MIIWLMSIFQRVSLPTWQCDLAMCERFEYPKDFEHELVRRLLAAVIR